MPSTKAWRPWEVKAELKSGENISLNNAHNNFKCTASNCNETLLRESEFRRHMLSKHLIKHERCSVCRKVFTRKDNLTRHFKLAHTPDEIPRCKYCSKSLSRRDAVERHESICRKNQSRKRDMSLPSANHLTHMQRIQMKHKKSQLSTLCPPSQAESKNSTFNKQTGQRFGHSGFSRFTTGESKSDNQSDNWRAHDLLSDHVSVMQTKSVTSYFNTTSRL